MDTVDPTSAGCLNILDIKYPVLMLPMAGDSVENIKWCIILTFYTKNNTLGTKIALYEACR